MVTELPASDGTAGGPLPVADGTSGGPLPVADGTADGPLFVLDGMSLAYRAYFALPADMATSGGVFTNAVTGFFQMLKVLVRDHRPSSMAVAFDRPEATFRDDLLPDYKAGRPETPDELVGQFPLIRDLVEALRIPLLEVVGYEADDVLATLATECRDRHCEVVIVTGDRDSFQLVEDPYIRVLYNKRGVSDYALYDEEGIVARTGVPPAQYPMLAALRGDKSDNLPGVPGVGDKTAAKLLVTYGDIDGIYGHLDELSPKLRDNLAAHEPQVRSNLTVIPLVRDVPLDADVAALTLGGWDMADLRTRFADLELKVVWRDLETMLRKGDFGPPAEGSEDLDEPGPGGPAGDPGHGDPGDTLLVAPTGTLEAPTTPAEAVIVIAAAREEAAAAPLSVAARWHGAAGRSALVGVVLVTGPDGSGCWLDGDLLTDAAVREALQVALDGPVAGHDVKELFRSLLGLGVDPCGLVMDLAVAAYLLDPSSGDYSLDALTALAHPENGVASAGAPGPLVVTTGQLALGGDEVVDPSVPATADATVVAQLVGPYRAQLEAEGLLALHDEIETPLVRVLARMEVAGIAVDTEELRRITDGLVAQVARLEGEMHRLAGHEFNVNSTPQLRTVLYDELGLTPGRKTKTGYSTDAATLESLRGVHAIVDTLLEYREVEKLRSTYGENLLAEVGPDGRIHASFRQTVARTGRLSSERPNLHNIPVRTEAGRAFRRAFVPRPGWRLLVADYDQVELRVLAHLSGDPGLIAAFGEGSDVHRAVAASVYGVPLDEVTREQRERAKMVSYGLVYGMEAYGLARRLSTGVDEAREIMTRFFDAFPAVRSYMDATVAEARQRGFTRTETGRKRPLPELLDANHQRRQAAERQAMNSGIQGLAADLFKTALVRLDAGLEHGGFESRLVLQVHDEVLVDLQPAEEAAVEALTRTCLTGAAELRVPLQISLHTGSTWDDAKGG